MKHVPTVADGNRDAALRRSPSPASHLQVFWRGMGLWKWPCLLLLVACIWLTPKAGPSPSADTWWKLPARKTGSMEVRAATSGQLRQGANVRVQLHFADAAPERAACRIADTGWREADLSAMNPDKDVLVVLAVPETAERFLLACELGTDGERSVVSWDLGRSLPLQSPLSKNASAR